MPTTTLVLCPTKRELHEMMYNYYEILKQPGLPGPVVHTANKTVTDTYIGRTFYFLAADSPHNIENLRGQVFTSVEGQIPDEWHSVVLSRVRKEPQTYDHKAASNQ